MKILIHTLLVIPTVRTVSNSHCLYNISNIRGYIKYVFVGLLFSSPTFLYLIYSTARSQPSVPRSKSEMDHIDSEKVFKRSATLPLPNRTSSLKSSPER